MVRIILLQAGNAVRWIANLLRSAVQWIVSLDIEINTQLTSINTKLDKWLVRLFPKKVLKGSGFWYAFKKELQEVVSIRYFVKTLVWLHLWMLGGFLLLVLIGTVGTMDFSKLTGIGVYKISVLKFGEWAAVKSAYAYAQTAVSPAAWNEMCSTQAVPLQHGISGYSYTATHHGLDFGGSIGEAVPSMQNGTVVSAGWSNEGYGNLVIISDGNFHTYYAHLSEMYVQQGEDVYKGQMIGAVGSTGNSTGPHLHYETRVGSRWVPINPLSLQAQQIICANDSTPFLP